MYGDEEHYEKHLQKQQQEAQRMRMNEQAGQQRLPIDMPQTNNVDQIEAARASIGMTEDEKKLASELLIFAIFLMIKSGDKDESKDAHEQRMNALLNKHERELIMRHRAIVAKAVNAASQRLPSAGAF